VLATPNSTRLTTCAEASLLTQLSRLHLHLILSESGAMDITTDNLPRLFVGQAVRMLEPIALWIAWDGHTMGVELEGDLWWRERASLALFQFIKRTSACLDPIPPVYRNRNAGCSAPAQFVSSAPKDAS